MKTSLLVSVGFCLSLSHRSPGSALSGKVPLHEKQNCMHYRDRMLGPTGVLLLESHGSKQLRELVNRWKGSLLERPGDRGWPALTRTPLRRWGEALPLGCPLCFAEF